MIYQYHLVDGEWSFVFSAQDVEVGYATLKNFVYVVNDVEKPVKVQASAVNTHIRRIKTFL